VPERACCIYPDHRRSSGLVPLGYFPKPYGSREPFGQLLSSLINNAHVVVIEVPSIVERRTISVHCFELAAGDEEIADTLFASRCFYILHLSN
jgi:hypothetical protein